jgi:hypothetical protein
LQTNAPCARLSSSQRCGRKNEKKKLPWSSARAILSALVYSFRLPHYLDIITGR